MDTTQFKQKFENDIENNLKQLISSPDSNDLNAHIISPVDDVIIYTPLQFGAKYGLVRLTHYLLKKDNVRLSFFREVVDIKTTKTQRQGLSERFKRQASKEDRYNGTLQSNAKSNCKIAPLLLAAENGHHEILKLFKYHNFSSEERPWTIDRCKENQDVVLGDNAFENFVTYSKIRRSANFQILDENKCTVLHLVLQQPLLKHHVGNGRESAFSKNIGLEAHENKQSGQTILEHYRHYASVYRECVNVLLDVDRFDGIDDKYNNYTTQIRSIINYPDGNGNTPFHYAVSNWSEDVVRKLLILGANAGLKNLHGEMPLSRISKSTFEEFLDKSCIIVEGFDPRDDEIEEADDTNDEKERELEKLAEDYSQTFMMRISQAGKEDTNNMIFDYAFLSPAKKLKSSEEIPSNHRLVSSSGMDIELNIQDGQEKDPLVYEPEMDLLAEISQSEQHKSLVTHPVISSFLWIKWKLIANRFNRSLRLDFLFCYCVIWHIFIHFGGKRWNTKTIGDDVSNRNQSQFCRRPEYTIQLKNFSVMSHSSYSMFGYYLFIIIFMAQLVLMVRDLHRDYTMRSTLTDPRLGQSPIVGCWVDLINVSLSILVIIAGQSSLWLIITLILVMYLITEVVQMTVNMTSFDFGYFLSIANLLDLGIITLVAIVIYLPPGLISNSHVFSIYDKKCNGKECKSEEESECKVLRCISGIVIVFIVVRYLMSIAKLPRFKGCNLYVLMYYKVMKRYIRIMIWYSFFIIAFGLGFYIMLHNDTENVMELQNDHKNETASNSTIRNTDDDRKKNKFRNPYHAIMKSSIMFIGEIEFGDLPIQGGDVSVAMSYFFVLMFIFLMVIVLINLLNGLAVGDIIEILEDSKIENQICLIDTIRLFELLYIGEKQKIQFPDERYTCNKNFFLRFIYRFIVPKGIFLFNSNYLKNKTLTFPLRRTIPCPLRNRNSENHEKGSVWSNITDKGSEEFLNDARKILIQERKRRIEARRMKTMEKLGKEMRRNIRQLVYQNSQNKP